MFVIVCLCLCHLRSVCVSVIVVCVLSARSQYGVSASCANVLRMYIVQMDCQLDRWPVTDG